MVSAPSRERLPALCLVLLGVGLCVLVTSGVAAPAEAYAYSIDETHTVHEYESLSPDTQQLIDTISDEETDTVTVGEPPSEFRSGEWNFVRNENEHLCVFVADTGDSYRLTGPECAGIAFEAESLSDRGQAYFSLALDDPDEQVLIWQDQPPEFSFNSGHNYPEPPDPNESNTAYSYIFKDGTAHGFATTGPGWMWMPPVNVIGTLLGGVVAVVVGIVSYAFSWSRAPLPFLAGTGVLALWWLVRALLTTLGEYRLLFQLNHQSPIVVAAIATILAIVGLLLVRVSPARGTPAE